MTTQKFSTTWDASTTETTGPETGSPTISVPATKRFIAGVGVPARVLNYGFWKNSDTVFKTAVHQAMNFRSSGNAVWIDTTVLNADVARGDYGFLVSSTSAVNVVLNQVDPASAAVVYSATVTRNVMVDDGTSIWSFDNQVNNTHQIGQSTANHSNNTQFGVPYAAGFVGTHGIVVGTSGTAVLAATFTSTFTTTTVPAGTYNFSTTAKWNKAEVFTGATTATGPLLFYSRDVTTNNYLYTTDGISLSKGTWPVSTSATKVADVSYDDDQGLFVLCTVPAAGGACGFYTSPDGVTWTASTATGPSSQLSFTATTDGSVAFAALGGVWFVATQSAYRTGVVLGAGGVPSLGATGLYSTDRGATWYQAGLWIFGTNGTVKIVKGVDRFLVITNSTIALSGRVAIPEAVT